MSASSASVSEAGYDVVDLDLPAEAPEDSNPDVRSVVDLEAAPPAVAPGNGQVAVPTTTPPSKSARPGLLARLRGTKAVPVPAVETESPAPRPKAPPGAPTLRRKQAKRSLKFEAPAWVVSVLVHVGILGALGLVGSLSPDVRDAVMNLNAAMIDPSLSGKQAEELTPILADVTGGPRDEAVAEIAISTPGGGGLGTGSGPPSATPNVGVRAEVNERRSLPGSIKGVAKLTGLSMMPTANVMSRDLGAGGAGGGNQIAGDVTFETKDIGQALDQLAREILRHLQAHKLTVVWLFDESGSMKDDQKAVKDKFDRITAELAVNEGADRKAAGALNHAIVGFGDQIHFEQRKPTTDINLIGKSIDRLMVDQTGTENVLHAIQAVIAEYGRLISKERRLLIVLVTDESGDDGGYIEEARQLAISRGVPVYVIGRQSLFGYDRAHLLYIDPVTKDHYWPAIKRGPETAGLEMLQYDGLHERWEEQPSGFAPYELARLAKDTGGIYFLLPSEENMRVKQREKAYSIQTLKEYVPDYESRLAYLERRNKSELRRSLFDIIERSAIGRDRPNTLVHRREYPVEPNALVQALAEERPKVMARLEVLFDIEKRMRALEKLRAREPEKRWQAHYDLMLAQIVTYEVKAYEYLSCLEEMVAQTQQGKLKPTKVPVPGKLNVVWVVEHSKARKAPVAKTEKYYAEADRLLKKVIESHPRTPWADLAQDEINRGFGCAPHEWATDPRYAERAKLVPKY